MLTLGHPLPTLDRGTPSKAGSVLRAFIPNVHIGAVTSCQRSEACSDALWGGARGSGAEALVSSREASPSWASAWEPQ